MVLSFWPTRNSTYAGNGVYNLTGLYRGLYGTTKRMFSTGSLFMFIGTNANYFVVDVPPAYVGKTFYVELQSFNAFNNYTEDLSTVAAYQYTITGSVVPTTKTPLTQTAKYRRTVQMSPANAAVNRAVRLSRCR